MKGLLALGAFSLFSLVAATNYVCPAGDSSTTITVEAGDMFTYKTQAGKKYGPNVNCVVNYKRGASCKKVGFGCKQVVIRGKKKNCKQGDKMIVAWGKKNKKFICGKKKVGAASGGPGIRVQFLTDGNTGRGVGPGGVCRVKCLEASQQPPSTSTSTPPTGENILEKISLEDYPLAQCNDLSPAVYYRHPEINQETSKKMIIYLKGGGYCVPGTGKNNCNARCAKPIDQNLCTAKTASTLDMGAEKLGKTIASKNETRNPAYHDFSFVYVPYCSSDFYSGTANASTATEGRAFQGKNIFRAVIASLLADTWLPEAEQVVLVGTSAGSIGVERNCDLMADTLKAVKPDMDVKCIIDSGTLIPIGAWADSCADNQDQSQSNQVLWQPELDESCLADSPDPTTCGALTNSYPYLDTPSMLITSVTDSNTIKSCDGAGTEPFMTTWRDELAALARNVSLDKPGFGFYVENCPFHTMLANEFIMFGHQVPVDDGQDTDRYNVKDLLVHFQQETGAPIVGIDDMSALNPNCNYNG